MLHFIKRLFTVQPYIEKVFKINGYYHQLLCDEGLFNRESLKIYDLLSSYYNAEEALFKASGLALDTFFARNLIQQSPVAICDNLTEFEDMLIVTDTDYSVKRWQDLLVTLHTVIDPLIVDVYMGRYFKQISEHHYIPEFGTPEETIQNVRDQHHRFPWTWVLVPYQQVNTSKFISLEKEYSNKQLITPIS
jgi:hypothetical protein